MYKQYRQALRSQFLDLIRHRCPDFCETKGWLPGEIAVGKQTHGGLVCVYVTIIPDLKGGQRFTVELGWSNKGRFPETNTRPSGFPTANRAEFQNDEFICRLGELSAGEDEWWWVESPLVAIAKTEKPTAAEAAERIQPLVLDAVHKIERFGIPYLNEYLKATMRL
jgi:hypothetical protein